jgi:hypothetical protein
MEQQRMRGYETGARGRYEVCACASFRRLTIAIRDQMNGNETRRTHRTNETEPQDVQLMRALGYNYQYIKQNETNFAVQCNHYISCVRNANNKMILTPSSLMSPVTHKTLTAWWTLNP